MRHKPCACSVAANHHWRLRGSELLYHPLLAELELLVPPIHAVCAACAWRLLEVLFLAIGALSWRRLVCLIVPPFGRFVILDAEPRAR